MASGWPGKGHGTLLKILSTPLPSTLQGLKNSAIAVFWRWCLRVWMRFWTTDWSYNDFFNRLAPSTRSVNRGANRKDLHNLNRRFSARSIGYTSEASSFSGRRTQKDVLVQPHNPCFREGR